MNAFDLWGISAIGETFIFVGKSSFKFYIILDVLVLMQLFLLLQQINEKFLILVKLTRGDPSSLSH